MVQKTVEQVNPDTGEIKELVQENVIKFNSMFNRVVPIIYQDLSREEEDVFQELIPYAIDPETGKFLNDSSVPKLVQTGKVNVQERIQSFAKECDLYSILEKFAYSDDPALINARACQYGDISELPNNLNDYTAFVDYHYEELKKMNPELAKLVLDENVKAEDIHAKATQILNERIEASKAEEAPKGEE